MKEEKEIICITLEGNDTILYRKMMRMLPENMRTEEVPRKLFREGLIQWATQTIMLGE